MESKRDETFDLAEAMSGRVKLVDDLTTRRVRADLDPLGLSSDRAVWLGVGRE